MYDDKQEYEMSEAEAHPNAHEDVSLEDMLVHKTKMQIVQLIASMDRLSVGYNVQVQFNINTTPDGHVTMPNCKFTKTLDEIKPAPLPAPVLS